MDPQTAKSILTTERGVGGMVRVDPPTHVTMIAATINEGAEGLGKIIDRVRQLAQNIRTAADQVYGECEGGQDMPVESPTAGSAGALASQMRELDRWVVQAEGEANRLCGSA